MRIQLPKACSYCSQNGKRGDGSREEREGEKERRDEGRKGKRKGVEEEEAGRRRIDRQRLIPNPDITISFSFLG